MSHEELTQRVIKVIANTQHMPLDKIAPESNFAELGIDSLDGINILFAIENEFNVNIPDEGAQAIKSVQEMVEGIAKLLAVDSTGEVAVQA